MDGYGLSTFMGIGLILFAALLGNPEAAAMPLFAGPFLAACIADKEEACVKPKTRRKGSPRKRRRGR